MKTPQGKDLIFKEDDFLDHIDSSPFMLYIMLAIFTLFGALLYNPQLFVYGLIPLALANMLGCYNSEKYILHVIDFTYFVYLGLFFRKINFF